MVTESASDLCHTLGLRRVPGDVLDEWPEPLWHERYKCVPNQLTHRCLMGHRQDASQRGAGVVDPMKEQLVHTCNRERSDVARVGDASMAVSDNREVRPRFASFSDDACG